MRLLRRRRGANRKRNTGTALPVRLGRAARRVGRVLRYALPAALGLALLSGAGWSVYRFVTTTPYFQLRTLELAGLSRLKEPELRAWAGLDGPTQLLTLDLDGLHERLEQHPWVADARVERFLPDRLVVRIVERKPVALVLLGSLHLVDQHGFVFHPSTGQGEERLPVVTGLSPEDFTTDRTGADLRLRQALAVLREWERQKLPPVASLSEVHLDPVLGTTLYTEEEGTRIQLGWSEHAQRLARLREVLISLRAEGKVPSYVLLDNEITPQRVTVGLRGGETLPGTVADRR